MWILITFKLKKSSGSAFTFHILFADKLVIIYFHFSTNLERKEEMVTSNHFGIRFKIGLPLIKRPDQGRSILGGNLPSLLPPNLIGNILEKIFASYSAKSTRLPSRQKSDASKRGKTFKLGKNQGIRSAQFLEFQKLNESVLKFY